MIEDTDVTRAEIDQKFGKEIGDLVEGLTKIKKLDLVTKKAEQAENFRKLLVAISSDIRVLLIKLADRLHNMRTLEHMKPESRQRVSEETLEIYAPLAGRMGMQTMREELEQLAFRWGNPEAYKTVVDKLAEIHKKNTGLVEEIIADLKGKLAHAGLHAEIYGRDKKPFSIWRKMQNRQISLEQLSDIYGFRVVVRRSSMPAIARSASCIRPGARCPGRFKDYISTPKQNNYQSIHTTVVGPRHQWVELQIRTGRACIKSPNTAWPRMPSTRTASSSANTAPTAAPRRRRKTLHLAAARWSTPCSRATTPKNSWSTPSSSCSRTRCSASRPRVG